MISSFLAGLSQLDSPLTTIRLDDGMAEADVRLMISDALGIVPRLCKTLSAQVYRKTKGSPFFVREFMRTLVDEDLVSYSLREKRWIWHVDEIIAKPITNNVLELITSKMHTLTQRLQTALKVASCFGIKVLSSIVKSLSSTQQYSGIQNDMEDAVEDGFIDFDGTHYRFSHDKVRQASYELIGDTVTNQFHFEIGMALYESVAKDDNVSNEVLFTTVEQINHGEHSLIDDESQRLSIAKLNYEAGLASLKSWNYEGALLYLKASCFLLPHDAWTAHYELSLNIYYKLATAAYSCGEIAVAKTALNQIDQKGKTLQDKLDSYYLLVKLLQHEQEDLSLALNTCCKTLKLLGEDVPDDTKIHTITQIVGLVQTRMSSSFESNSGKMLSSPRTECRKTKEIMRFYYQLALVSYTKGNQDTGRLRGLLCGYYISRWVSYCLNNQAVCKHTCVALGFCKCVIYYIPPYLIDLKPSPNNLNLDSTMLVHGFNESSCHEGYKVGKVALKFLQENEDQNELPGT